MKFALIIAVVLVGIWLFRSGRRQDSPPAKKAREPAGSTSPLDMVRCRHCDVHLPAADSVQGKLGLYCSPEHRQRSES